MKLSTVLGLVLMCWLSTPRNGVAPTRILPVDEGAGDAGFAAYRRDLLRAATAADAAGVLALVADPVRYEEDAAPESKAKFARRWKLNSSSHEFMRDLASVLRLGGRFTRERVFVAPYPFTDFDGSDEEMVSHVVVVSADAPVREAPSESGRMIARLSYDVLPFTITPTMRWVSVELKDGKTGYMHARDVWHPNGPRAHFQQIQGKWRLVVFAQGVID